MTAALEFAGYRWPDSGICSRAKAMTRDERAAYIAEHPEVVRVADAPPTQPEQPGASAADLLTLAHPGEWTVVTLDPSKPKGRAIPQPTRIAHGDTDSVARWIAQHDGKLNMHWFPATSKAGVHKTMLAEADMDSAAMLWAEIDPEGGERFESSRAENLERLQNHRPAPSVVVDTGNGCFGGWLLKQRYAFSDAAAVAAFKSRLKQLAVDVEGDPSGVSINHLMRLPDGRNLLNADKIAKGYPAGERRARIVTWHPDRVYDFGHFGSAPPDDVAAPGSAPREAAIDWEQATELAAQYATELPPGLPPKARVILEHEGGKVEDLRLALDEQGLLKDDKLRTGPAMSMALVAALKLCGKFTPEQIAALAGCERPCNSFGDWKKIKNKIANANVRRHIKKYLAESYNERPAASGEWPDGCNKFGTPYPGYGNVGAALDKLGLKFSYDEFRLEEHVGGLKFTKLNGKLSDPAVSAIRDAVYTAYGFYPAKEHAQEAIQVRCRANSHNPVVDYFNSLVWDGTPRLDKMLHRYLGADDTPLNAAYSRKVMCASVQRVKQPGCKFDHQLVVQGEQGFGKSTWCCDLAMEQDLHTDCSEVGMSIKESREVIGGKQIIEVAEMAGSRSDRNKNKAFLTRRVDRARMSYDRYASEAPRTSITISTINEGGYLDDPTGERRFWHVAARRYDREAFLRDKDQLWAEAVARQSHEKLWLDTSELIAAHDAITQTAKVPNELVDELSDLRGVVFGNEERVSNKAVRAHLGVLKPDVLRLRSLGSQISDAMLSLGWSKRMLVCEASKDPVRGFSRPAQDHRPVQKEQEGSDARMPF